SGMSIDDRYRGFSMYESLPDPSIIKPRPSKIKKSAKSSEVGNEGKILLLIIAGLLILGLSLSAQSGSHSSFDMKQAYADKAYREASKADFALNHGDMKEYRTHIDNAAASIYLYQNER